MFKWIVLKGGRFGGDMISGPCSVACSRPGVRRE